MSTSLTMSHVLQQFLPAYKADHHLSPDQSKAIGSICCCRTSQLGGHSLVCDHCHHQCIQYHSCRNRHCPQCQHQATEQWREKRCEDVLPVPYFHLVFTLPHELNGWTQLHPEVIYRLLFKAAWATLQQFGRDPKRLNGQLGMTAVLHTWSQNLGRHTHLHCLVPGGALSEDGQQWKPATSTYLFPVQALSRCFRGKMVSLLREAWAEQDLDHIESAEQVDEVLDQLMSKDWVVYARHTCLHTEAVVAYLAQYTYRIAISDHRLVSIDGDQVRFRWKDYAAGGVRKVMSLKGVEFIRRFLMHVLPNGFMRIRHYGFLANCHRKVKLALIRDCLHVAAEDAQAVIGCLEKAVGTQTSDLSVCPKCRRGFMQVTEVIEPLYRRR